MMESACRATYTDEQVATFELYYEKDPKLTAARRKIIAGEVKCTTHQVNIWFQNRRARGRRDSNRITRSRTTDIRSDQYSMLTRTMEHHPELLTGYKNGNSKLHQNPSYTMATVPPRGYLPQQVTIAENYNDDMARMMENREAANRCGQQTTFTDYPSFSVDPTVCSPAKQVVALEGHYEEARSNMEQAGSSSEIWIPLDEAIRIMEDTDTAVGSVHQTTPLSTPEYRWLLEETTLEHSEEQTQRLLPSGCPTDLLPLLTNPTLSSILGDYNY